MTAGCRHKAVVLCSLMLFCSLGFGAWEQLNSGTMANLYSVHFPEGTQVGYAVGEVPESLVGWVVVKTTDGGANWVSQFIETTYSLNSVYFKDNNNGFAVGYAGKAVRTTDGGTTWTPMTVPCTDNLTRVQFPENGQIGYIGVHPRAGGGKVLKSINGGDNWDSIAVGGPLATSYSCGMATDNQGVVFGLQGMLAGSTDGFATSTAQGPNTPGDLVAAAFTPTDPNRGYLIGNDNVSGLGVIRFTATFGPVWDSVRCWNVPAFYGVDVPTSTNAYVCGADGKILRSVADKDFFRTTVPTGFTATLYGLCFLNGADTGYAVGAGGAILRTYDGGGPWFSVAEEKGPAMSWTGIRVVSNPSRHGIAFHADADVDVIVFDASGRVVVNQAATKGLNSLPVPEAGVYFVWEAQAQAQAVHKVIISR